ncbi:Hypothetical protein NGAL_HAMBI2610_23510 [Neorhizobium galegae bv. orientalis]|nr:Hypothetical protein NGAL_HAMBI2610_23510 [Neorhizobium galegae bv. orientalis]
MALASRLCSTFMTMRSSVPAATDVGPLLRWRHPRSRSSMPISLGSSPILEVPRTSTANPMRCRILSRSMRTIVTAPMTVMPFDVFIRLMAVDAVFKSFRTSFLGKSSPVRLFWGSFDLAVTRFSGRQAPIHPGGFPALPDDVAKPTTGRFLRQAFGLEAAASIIHPGSTGLSRANRDRLFKGR